MMGLSPELVGTVLSVGGVRIELWDPPDGF